MFGAGPREGREGFGEVGGRHLLDALDIISF